MFFQNCSPGFEALQLASSDRSLESGPPTPQEDVPADPTGALSVFVRNAESAYGKDIAFKVELNKPHTSDIAMQMKSRSGTALANGEFPEREISITIPAGSLEASYVLPNLAFGLATTSKNLFAEIVSVSAGVVAQKVGTATLSPYLKSAGPFKQISTGSSFTCAITSQDTVKCWGNNTYGVLGIEPSSSFSSELPVSVAGLSAISQITAGANHACTLSNQGLVKCWGLNLEGQLGNGNNSDSYSPMDVAGLNGAKQVSAGETHTCAITAQNTVKCWGSNAFGELGNGTTTPTASPVDASGITDAKQVVAGDGRTCALMNQGNVKCWGRNTVDLDSNSSLPVDVQNLTGIQEISLGWRHACARNAQNLILCWGQNSGGALGDKVALDAFSALPVEVTGATAAKQISTRATRNCIVTNQNTVLCWGYGVPGKENEVTSVPIAIADLSNTSQISIGSFRACALAGSGTVRCWAAGNAGPPLTSLKGIDIPLIGAKQIAAGAGHVCGLMSDGTVRCLGNNNLGQLGDGTQTERRVAVNVNGISGAKQIAAGVGFTCAITADNKVKCWGASLGGARGDFSSTPVEITGLADVVSLAGGLNHACAASANGSVKCWGNNSFGQLGDGSTTASSTPVDAVGVSTATQVIAGLDYTCTLTNQGGVKCWGQDSSLQLTNNPSNTLPADIVDLTGVREIAGGHYHLCAITAASKVLCRGANLYGEVGDGTRGGVVTAPREVVDLTDAKSINLSSGTSCAVLKDGSGKCWGYNGSGALADGSTKNAVRPVAIADLKNIRQIIAGSQRTHILLEDGRLKTFGTLYFSDPPLKRDVLEPL